MTEKTPPESAHEKNLIVKTESDRVVKTVNFIDYLKLCIALIIFSASFWLYSSNSLTIPLYWKSIALVAGIIISLALILFWCQFGRDFLNYVRDSYAEFKKVVWLSRSESIKITIRVIIFVIVLSVFIYGVDSLISILFNSILLKG